MSAAQTHQIRRMAKIKAKAYWRNVDAVAKAEGLSLAEARAKVDAANRADAGGSS